MNKDFTRLESTRNCAYLQALRLHLVRQLIEKHTTEATGKDAFVELYEQRQEVLEASLDAASLEKIKSMDEQLLSILAKAVYAGAYDDFKAYEETLQIVEDYGDIGEMLDNDHIPLDLLLY